ncbi:MAG TPA: alanine--tRNA ligase [Gammaproteobacteria bacterium]|nr:alanine--tRNA ligase [Gammaproteobacteria bacterium]
MKTSNEIRQAFLDYFASQGHTIVASSPLVPANDPTLLFTNAGMVQFKDVFLGRDNRDYLRATSSQKCLRAGGKHNDLENVGYTARHHTFFEMLGNFSFGDYFKRDAIKYAWELLTTVYKLPADKLWVTVYHTDDEAYDVWAKEVGVPQNRIVRIGDKPGGRQYESDNFWQMADTGPCGPCSEIFYDHGPDVAGGPPGSVDADGDRYIEIWNLVFMQFDRADDGSMAPLPKPCVDTGMGLERIAAVLQGVHSNYEIDLFQHLIKAAAEITGAKDLNSPSLKVIADHIRACAFLIADGVLPSNEGRGYVLRRIIRRAIRHGYKLGQEKPFFHKLVKALDQQMGKAYPELHKASQHVAKVLLQEEERFAETLDKGMRLLEQKIIEQRALKFGDELLQNQYRRIEQVLDLGRVEALYEDRGSYPKKHIWFMTRRYSTLEEAELTAPIVLVKQQVEAALPDQPPSRKGLVFLVIVPEAPTSRLRELLDLECGRILAYGEVKVLIRQISDIESMEIKLGGDIAFLLYDTYGFPLDLTADICRERGLTLDTEGFEREMEKQRERARAASQFNADYGQDVEIDVTTKFTGYDALQGKGKVVALFRGKDAVKSLKAGEQGMVILDQTPFYAESGGQVGDKGTLSANTAEFKVEDTQKRGGGAHAHLGIVTKGELKVGDNVGAQVDQKLRAATVLNHSATHLLHAALRQVLGTHVTQKGSLVAPDRLRFDFSHYQPITAAELQRVEDLVNEQIRHNAEADVHEMAYDDAIQSGAMALFGEKYGNTVRVMKFGDFSTELCGGTHVSRVGDIGLFKIVSESGVAAGVRRIEAVTGEGALVWVHQAEQTLRGVAELTKGGLDNIEEKVSQLLERNRKLEKELEQLKGKMASRQGGDLAAQAVDVNGVKVLASRLDGADARTLRDTVDQLKNKLGSAAIVLAAVEDGKVRLVAGVTADRMGKLKAGELVNAVAQQVGGKGGGRPDMAQAGGDDPAALDAALHSVPDWVRAHLG